MNEHSSRRLLNPQSVAAYTNPQPGNLVVILTDGEVFASQEFPYPLTDDTPVFEAFASRTIPRLLDALEDLRRERDGSSTPGSPDQAPERPTESGSPGRD